MQLLKAAPLEAPVDAAHCSRRPASAVEVKAAIIAAQNTITVTARPPQMIALRMDDSMIAPFFMFDRLGTKLAFQDGFARCGNGFVRRHGCAASECIVYTMADHAFAPVRPCSARLSCRFSDAAGVFVPAGLFWARRNTG